jgi:hypothetical protein
MREVCDEAASRQDLIKTDGPGASDRLGIDV